MPRSGSSRPMDQSSRRSTREPSTTSGGSRRSEDRTEAPTAPPPFSSIAPTGHGIPQPAEDDDYDDETRAPTYYSTADRTARTSASTRRGRDQGRTQSTNPPDYTTRAPRGPRAARETRLSTLEEEPGTAAATRTATATRTAGVTRTTGTTRAGGPRGTTLAPRRGTRIDVEDHGVFSSEEEEPGSTVRPTRRTSGRTSGGRTETAISSRAGDRTMTRRQTGRSETRDYTRTRDSTVGRTRTNGRSAWRDGRTATAGPTRQTRTRGATSYGRTRGYEDDEDEEDYDDDEEYDEEADDEQAEAVRAKVKWYDPRNPPRPHRAGYRDENLVYQIEGDDYEVYQYVMPTERADGGLAVLQEIDRRAQHLRDRHFSALELWTRAFNSGLLRKIVSEDQEGYTYWTIENHNYDVAWACAQQGWWILGTGIGKDKGNFFMEQKDVR